MPPVFLPHPMGQPSPDQSPKVMPKLESKASKKLITVIRVEEGNIEVQRVPTEHWYEREANDDFVAFVAKYFQSEDGHPDKSKTKKPIAFQLYKQDDLYSMQLAVIGVQDLVLLRKDTFHLVIGWKDAMWPLIEKALEKRRPLKLLESSLQSVQLNIEPKHFFRRYLGIDVDSPHPTPKYQRFQPLVTLDRSNIMNPALAYVLSKEPDLVMDCHGQIALLGWHANGVAAEKQRLAATDSKRSLEKDRELRNLKRYWTGQAKVHKEAQSDAYFWALHHVIRTKICRSPGPPKQFEISLLPGSYIVKIGWCHLMKEFCFPGWNSGSPSAKFGCQGREAAAGEMKLHMQTDTQPGQEGKFTAKFHFGLIEGTMHLSSPQETLTSELVDEPDNSVTKAVHQTTSQHNKHDSSLVAKTTGSSRKGPTAKETEEDSKRRGFKRRFNQDANFLASEPAPKRVWFEDLPNDLLEHKQHHNDRRTGGSEPISTTSKSRNTQKHTIRFTFSYKVVGTASPASSASTGANAQSLLQGEHLFTAPENRGRLIYYDGSETVYLGTKGYFRCPSIADGDNKISIYRISEGKPLKFE